MQQYRNQEDQMRTVNSNAIMGRHGLSFDGDSAAELEEWMKGDSESCALDAHEEEDQNITYGKRDRETRRSGPIDLDEAYERRSEVRTGSSMISGDGWREGRQESLGGISETKTAADFHLEAALGMSSMKPQQFSSPLGRGLNNDSLNNREPALMGQMEVDEDGFPSPTTRRNKSMGSQEGGSCYSSPSSSPLEEEYKLRGIDTSMSEERVRAAGRRLPSPKLHDDVADFDYSPDSYSNKDYSQTVHHYHQRPVVLQPPTEEALRWKDSRSAPPRPGGSVMLKGYRGFIDKTTDVPNLIDDLESEASTSLGTSAYSSEVRRPTTSMGLALPPAKRNGRTSPRGLPIPHRESSNVDSESDVFDGCDSSVPSTTLSSMYREEFGHMENQILDVNSEDRIQQQRRSQGSGSAQTSRDFADRKADQLTSSGNSPFSLQSNPFAATRNNHYSQGARVGAGEEFLDPTLDISAVSSNGGSSQHDFGELDQFGNDFESFPDLSQYSVEPQLIQVLVRTFRKICTALLEKNMSGERTMHDTETLDDTKKAFALFEMRSRIMETDIDRGLERRGGTNVVDDVSETFSIYFTLSSISMP